MANRKQNKRAQRSADAILHAARHILMTEGASAVTHQHVAEVAGVGRATVYRHWATVDDLILALFENQLFPFLEPEEEGTFRERLHQALTLAGAFYASDQFKPLVLTVPERALWDPRMRSLLDVIFDRAGCNITAAITASPPDIQERLITRDPSALTSMFLGPLYLRAAMQNEPIDDQFIDMLIDAVLSKTTP